MPSRNCKARPLAWRISNDRRVNELRDPWAMLAYTWLIPSADNVGRLEGDADMVASMLFPRQRDVITPGRMADILARLHQVGLVCWYTVNGERFLQFPVGSWSKHQKLVGNMQAESDFPSPDPAEYAAWLEHRHQRPPNVHTGIYEFEPVLNEEKRREEEEKGIEDPPLPPHGGGDRGDQLSAPSSIANPAVDPPPGESLTVAAKRSVKTAGMAAGKTPRERPSTTPAGQQFDQFWAVYPKKRAKGEAEKAWSKLRVDEPLLVVILAAIERAKTSEDWRKEGGRFIPYPATWLNAKGWEDEYSPAHQEEGKVHATAGGSPGADHPGQRNYRTGKYAGLFRNQTATGTRGADDHTDHDTGPD